MNLENKYYFLSCDTTLVEFRSLDNCLTYMDEIGIKPILDESALYHFLRNGIVVPPYTIYRHIFTCAANDEICISKGKIVMRRNEFRTWWHSKRSFLKQDNVLDLLANNLASSVSGNQAVLMLSSGKDSNLLLCAAAKANLREEIKCVTIKSDIALNDESVFAARLCTDLGFNHIQLEELGRMSDAFVLYLREYFSRLSEPASDFVILQYPWLLFNNVISKNDILIDGGGNDQYLGIATNKRDHFLHFFFKYQFFWRLVGRLFRSRLKNYVGRSLLERFMLSRTTPHDVNEIVQFENPPHSKWNSVEKDLSRFSLSQIKSYVVCTLAANEQHLKKVRLQSAFVKKVVFPFLDVSVINALIDQNHEENPKQHLLDLLQKELPDCDFTQKKGFSLNISKFVYVNLDLIIAEISECQLINLSKIKQMAKSCDRDLDPLHYESSVIFQVYVLCLWINSRFK